MMLNWKRVACWMILMKGLDIFVHTLQSGRPTAFDITVSSSMQSSLIRQVSQETGFCPNAAEERKYRKFMGNVGIKALIFFPFGCGDPGWMEYYCNFNFQRYCKKKSYFDNSVYNVEISQSCNNFLFACKGKMRQC